MPKRFFNLLIKQLSSLWILLLIIASAHAAQANEYQPLSDFGENPGELTADYFVPENYNHQALVVLLHGCVQQGITLANDSGLTSLAQQHHFAILAPQQSYENNVKACFNWFSNQDTQLDSGEMLSIHNMISAAQQRLEAKQVYLVGLSAGGAMASALLLNYPQQFQAGAIIAGLTYPCADNLTKAISCMKSGPSYSIQELVTHAKDLHPQQQSWPSLSIWTGTKDLVVNPVNSERLALHWAELTQAKPVANSNPRSGIHTRTWESRTTATQISLTEIDNMGHGIAVNPDIQNGGIEAPFLLKTPISTMVEIIKNWNI
ncbi:PHB depolymerase family esterase [Shewanella sp. Isolate11]|uniref:extracellular catalytic domain type 1 short-chain-length polyhydroxyalkanoate depolymerase n=1 Tax=Shewanella sp. Isolate11 TaxID=2908530 RepID=UPI001EFD49EF|nr:PHB depolymerase family esterase [Shewanella sp. Isolate11]MCG9697732.1 PHB depolymerase family esterase [Shewanella sp. Isolate11]